MFDSLWKCKNSIFIKRSKNTHLFSFHFNIWARKRGASGGRWNLIAVTHPVSSRFDLFDPRIVALWRSEPGSVSGTGTCCSLDRACACWLPVGWLGRPWPPVSVWWESWRELPSSPPLTFGRGVSSVPIAPLFAWFGFSSFFFLLSSPPKKINN